ncbi:hypothetical protein O181_022359 [Austropuccinia psidii MF-1]|uniref:Uncharacterized protein n=1 Tax=Austropuccinia psidii MF-1 TaxID=1389203 RepID=A0A9Q3CEM0_9BASI|nr:hypothetical protein [Austropuccinia psidii MF-1]
MNHTEKLLHTLPRMSTLLNENEGSRISNPQLFGVENSKLRNKFSISFHTLDPSMGQALLEELPKLKEWPDFSGEGEHDHMGFIGVIDIIKEDFELLERLITERFNTLFTRSAHIWYIKLRQVHGYQSWACRKTQITNRWADYSWILKVETSYEYSKFNGDKCRV